MDIIATPRGILVIGGTTRTSVDIDISGMEMQEIIQWLTKNRRGFIEDAIRGVYDGI
jgi:hypothetical protein